MSSTAASESNVSAGAGGMAAGALGGYCGMLISPTALPPRPNGSAAASDGVATADPAGANPETSAVGAAVASKLGTAAAAPNISGAAAANSWGAAGWSAPNWVSGAAAAATAPENCRSGAATGSVPEANGTEIQSWTVLPVDTQTD